MFVTHQIETKRSRARRVVTLRGRPTMLRRIRHPSLMTLAMVVCFVTSIVADQRGERKSMPQVLTADLVRKFLITQPELIKAMGEPPKQAPISVFGTGDEQARFYDSIPAARKVFDEIGWTAMEFVQTSEIIVRTMTAVGMVEAGIIPSLPNNILKENVQLLQNLPTEIAPMFELWKQNALEPALKELRDARTNR